MKVTQTAFLVIGWIIAGIFVNAQVRHFEDFAFALPDQNGEPIHLSSFKGKYVLVRFWDPSCDDCEKEIADLFKLARYYSDDSLVIYQVGLGPSEALWRRRVEKEFPPNIINVWCDVPDRIKIIPNLRITVVPYSFLLSPTQKVLWEGEISFDRIRALIGKAK